MPGTPDGSAGEIDKRANWEKYPFLRTCIVSDPLYAELVSLLCEFRLLGFE